MPGVFELLILVCFAATVGGGIVSIVSALRIRGRLPFDQRHGVAVGRLVLGILMVAIPTVLFLGGVALVFLAIGSG